MLEASPAPSRSHPRKGDFHGQKEDPKAHARQTSYLENRELMDLEAAAIEYVENRDERMAALKEEVKLKEKVLDLMKKHKKTTYAHGGITIEVVPVDEKIKVKVQKEGEGEPVDMT